MAKFERTPYTFYLEKFLLHVGENCGLVFEDENFKITDKLIVDSRTNKTHLLCPTDRYSYCIYLCTNTHTPFRMTLDAFFGGRNGTSKNYEIRSVNLDIIEQKLGFSFIDSDKIGTPSDFEILKRVGFQRRSLTFAVSKDGKISYVTTGGREKFLFKNIKIETVQRFPGTDTVYDEDGSASKTLFFEPGLACYYLGKQNLRQLVRRAEKEDALKVKHENLVFSLIPRNEIRGILNRRGYLEHVRKAGVEIEISTNDKIYEQGWIIEDGCAAKEIS